MTPEKLLENLYAIAYSLPEQERRFFLLPGTRHRPEHPR